MSEKKSFVIKVKYPAAGKETGKNETALGTITEWNVKRIGLALGALGVVLLAIYFAGGSEEKNEKVIVAESPPPVAEKQVEAKLPAINPGEKTVPAAKNTSVESVGSDKVVRALLTNGIEKNEPVNTISLPLKIDKKETVGIYYFAELQGMKGKTVIHEWYLNEQLVSQKKVNISSDSWRTSSKQVISYTMNNDWKVRLIDEAGNTINEKKFNLELK